MAMHKLRYHFWSIIYKSESARSQSIHQATLSPIFGVNSILPSAIQKRIGLKNEFWNIFMGRITTLMLVYHNIAMTFFEQIRAVQQFAKHIMKLRNSLVYSFPSGPVQRGWSIVSLSSD
jgi:hypothetical protein